MKKDKLLHLFFSLSPKEVKALKTFVVGRKPEKISHLVEFLAKIKKKEEDQNFEKIRQKAFKKLFPNQKDNTQNFRRLVADTLSILNDFLALQQTREDPEIRRELLREQYKNRLLSDLYESTLEYDIKQLKEQPDRDFHHYNSMSKLLNDRVYYKRPVRDGLESMEEDLLEIDKSVDMSFLITKLHHACHMKMRQLIMNLPSRSSLLNDAFYNYIKPYENDPVINLYLAILKLADTQNEEDYHKVKSKWKERLHLLSENLKLQTSTFLVNLCWFAVDPNIRLTEMYKLYRFSIQQKLLVNSGYINLVNFNNYIELCSSLGKYDEVRAFIKEYLPFLREGKDHIQNIQNLYESILLFGEQKYDDALLKSFHLQFHHHSFGLRSYVLIIRCLYELKKEKSLEELETRCTAFKQYLHRKYKEGFIPKATYDGNVNFTKIVLLLPNASTSKFAPISPDQLKEKMEAMSYIISRSWLLEKIEALP